MDNTLTATTDNIQVGQRYQSTNQAHLGWLVEVIRVTALQVETEMVSPHHGERNAYPRASFLRDYELVRDVKTLPIPASTNGTATGHRVCKVCQELKPMDAYQPVTINRGNNKGQQSGHYKICRTCVGAAKLAGRGKTRPPKPSTTRSIPALARPTSLLSQRLLDLASEVERLEAATQHSELLAIAQVVVQEAEYAAGVLVLRQETFLKLEAAVQKGQP